MQVGSTIGQYRLVRKIGEGGMGVVFAGEHVLIGRRAAIKILRPEVSKNRGSLKRFFNEARATAAIQDPGIVQLFDVGLTRDKSAYIVMELLDGESLDVRLRRVGSITAFDALRIARQVAGTLAVVHGAGIVHRDLKPGNLFSLADATAPGGERIKILDFGVAKLGPDLVDGGQTQAGAILGTPLYMSPEQCSGAEVDPRADIYSLGCVVFRLLTGRPPFAVEGMGPMIAAHLSEPATPPGRFVPELPRALDELVLRCLAKSRADRFPTMAELADECDRLLGALSGEAGAPLARLPEATTALLDPSSTLANAIGEKPPSAVSRRRWLGTAAAIGIAGGIVTAIVVSQTGDTRAASQALPPTPPRAEAAAAVVIEPPVAGAGTPDAATDAPIEAATEATTGATEPVAARAPGGSSGSAKPAVRAVTNSPAAPKPHSKPHRDLYEDRN